MGCVPKHDLCLLDEMFLRKIRRKASPAPSHDLEKTLGKAVLMFSDQQIVTGIALLASGYSQLSSGLDAYHWQIIVYLAWFSSLTHLTTLTVLRNYFQDHPATRTWRLILMIVTVSLLGVALLPTGNVWWLGDPDSEFPDTSGVPASCFFQGRYFSKQTQSPSMIISLLVLVFGYVTRVVKLWPSISNFTTYWLKAKPGNTIKKWLRVSHACSKQPNANVCWTHLRMVFEIIFILTLAYSAVLGSMLWEVSHSALQIVSSDRSVSHACNGYSCLVLKSYRNNAFWRLLALLNRS